MKPNINKAAVEAAFGKPTRTDRSGHDPLCNEAWKHADAMSGRGIEAADCWLCHLIARIRADEREAARDAVAAAQAEAGDINFCKDCADWSVAAIDGVKP